MAKNKVGEKTGLKPRADGRIRKTISFYNAAGVKVTETFYARSDKEMFEKVAAFQERVQRGRLFREVAEEWQTEHWLEIGEGTQWSYNKPLRDLIDAFGDRPINQISPMEISQYIGKRAQCLSKQSTRVIRSVVSQIMDYAIIHQDLRYNFMDAVKIPKNMVDGHRDLPTDAQLQAVIDNVDKPFGLFAYMILFGGFRRGELLALDLKSDVDFKTKRITINKGVVFRNGSPEIKNSPKTKAGVREVFLTSQVEQYLKQLPKGQRTIFPGKSKDGLMTESEYQTAWKNYCKEAGLSHKEQRVIRNGKLCWTNVPDITAHQLRHGYATLLYEADVDVKDAQLLMGHANIKTTLDVYTHIRTSRHNRAFLKVNNFNFDFNTKIG